MVFVFNLNYQFDFLTWVYLKNTCLSNNAAEPTTCTHNTALQLFNFFFVTSLFNFFNYFYSLWYFFSKYTFEEGEIFITVFTLKTVSWLFVLFVSVNACRMNVLKIFIFFSCNCIYYDNSLFSSVKIFIGLSEIGKYF